MDGHPTVRRNLAHWLIHVSASASASFLFAYRCGWSSLPAVVGMLVGVAFFVALYTWIWSSHWFGHRVPAGSAGRQALLYGTRVRSVLGLLGFLSVLVGDSPGAFRRGLSIFFMPDLLAGLRACEFVTTVSRVQPARLLQFPLVDAAANAMSSGVFFGSVESLVPTFFVTLAEGLLLTIFLLAIAGVCRVLIGLYAFYRPAPQLVGTGL